MAVDPYSWAARIGEQGYTDKQNAQQYEQNALMQLFQEEAMRQRAQLNQGLDLESAAARLAMQEPYQIRQEQRGLENDMALRRYYAENPIPRASEDSTAVDTSGGPVDNGDGTVTVTIGGKPFTIPKAQL